jgi:hypothetical protein
MEDPGQRVEKDQPHRPDDDFLAVGPALRILQLNVEGLSAAKRSIISAIADQQNIDIICLQETHVEEDRADRLNINGYDLVSRALHAKHGRATYVRSNIAAVAHLLSTPHCDVSVVSGYHIANVYKPPSEPWSVSQPLPTLPHPAIFVGDFNSHHPDWGYSDADPDGDLLQNWASYNDVCLVHDCKQRGTFRSARWQRDYSPDLCWVSAVDGHSQPASHTVLDDFPHSQRRPSVLHVGLRLPVVRGVVKRRWNFGKADWAEFTDLTESAIPHISLRCSSVEQAYTRFTRALTKAAHSAIPRGFRPAYIPCMDTECSRLLKQYEESGDPDIADHLIESLDKARKNRWEESTAKMDLTHSSRKSLALIRRLGLPKSTHPPVRANYVAGHLVKSQKPRVKESLGIAYMMNGVIFCDIPRTSLHQWLSPLWKSIVPCNA